MKITIFSIAVNLLATITLYAQNITFTDASLKTALIEHGSIITGSNISTIDTNGDGEISTQEATIYNKTIDLRAYNVTNLNGLEHFKNIRAIKCGEYLFTANFTANTALESIECGGENLTAINLGTNSNLISLLVKNAKITSLYTGSTVNLEDINLEGSTVSSVNFYNNTALVNLNINNTQLNTLSLSKNTALKNLKAENNALQTLDLSNNIALEYVELRNNALVNLDCSANTALEYLDCQENNLAALNLANTNNANLELIAKNNPNLTCITIDTNFTPPNYWQKDASASYSTSCGISSIGNPNGTNSCGTAPAIKYFKGFYETTQWMQTVTQVEMGSGTSAMFYKFTIPQNTSTAQRTLSIKSCSFNSSKGSLYVGTGNCGNLNQNGKFAQSCFNGNGESYYNGNPTSNTTYTIEWNSGGQGANAPDPFYWEWQYDGPEVCDKAAINNIIVDRNNNTVTIDFTENGNNGNYQIYIVEAGTLPVLGNPTKVVSSSPATVSGLDKNKYYRIYISAPCSNAAYQSGFNWDSYDNFDTFNTEAPENDALCNAQEILVNTTSTNYSYTNTNASTQNNEPNANCFSSNSQQTVWFYFTAPASGKVKISTDLDPQGTNDNTEMALYNQPSNCNDLTTLGTAIACDQDSGVVNDGNNAIITHAGLTPNTTYYLQIGGSTDGSFGVEIEELPADTQPEAAPISVNNLDYNYSLEKATYSGTSTNCGTPLKDYWLSFTAPQTGEITINTTTNTGKTAQLAIYYINNNTLESLNICAQNSVTISNTNSNSKTINGLTPNTTYYIMVFTEVGNEFNSFSMRIEASNTLSVSEYMLENNFSLYPNPAKNWIAIQTNSNFLIENLSIYSLTGQKLLHIKKQENNNKIFIQQLKSGIYLLRFNANNKLYSKKLIVE